MSLPFRETSNKVCLTAFPPTTELTSRDVCELTSPTSFMDFNALHTSPTTHASAGLEGSGHAAPSSAPHDGPDSKVNIPPRKLQRTIKAKRKTTANIGSSKGFIDLPIEIFTQIVGNILPVDILHLARTSKTLRNLLMQRSSAHLWRGAVHNLPGLPPCPPHLCEPLYFALLFTKTCMECGAHLTKQMDPHLYVLLCVRCRPNALIRRAEVYEPFRPLLPWSMDIVTASDRNMKCGYYALSVDVQRLKAEYDDRKRQGHFLVKSKEDAWYRKKKTAQQMREEASHELGQFLRRRKQKIELEIEEKKHAFRKSVEARLVAMGWEPDDVDLPRSRAKEWRPLLEQAKILNDRMWDKLYPKLLPLLKDNREERLAWERQMARYKEFKSIWTRMGQKCPAYIVHGPTSSTLNKFLPPAEEAMEWPCIKQILDIDTSPNEIKGLINERRSEILQAMQNWRNGIEKSLADCLRQDESARADPEIPLTVSLDCPLSPDLALLLRADSVFMYSGDCGVQYFPSVLGDPLVGLKDNILSASWNSNLNNVVSHNIARQLAKAFLKELGCPNMSYLSIKHLGERFVCGRCHDELPDTLPMSWEGIILHYVERRNLWVRHQDHINEWRSKGFTFNNIHGVDYESNKPLIRLISAEASERMAKSAAASARDQNICYLCVYGTNGPFGLEGIAAHLRNVHGLTPNPDHHRENSNPTRRGSPSFKETKS